jgi:hypothetical protein
MSSAPSGRAARMDFRAVRIWSPPYGGGYAPQLVVGQEAAAVEVVDAMRAPDPHHPRRTAAGEPCGPALHAAAALLMPLMPAQPVSRR